MTQRFPAVLALLAVLAAAGAALLVRSPSQDRPGSPPSRTERERPPARTGAAPTPEVARVSMAPAPPSAGMPTVGTPAAGTPDAKAPETGARDAKLHGAQLAAAPDPTVAAGTSYVVEPPFAIVDGRTFATESGSSPTRLAGLDGPAAEAVCLDEAGHLWACGLQARAALNNLIRKQAVACRTTAPASGNLLLATCRVEAGDLARELVRAGFARAAPDAAATFASDEAAARRDARGLWRGGWTIRP